MEIGHRIPRPFVWLGILVLQIIMTQVVTLCVSLLLPGMEDFPQTRPLLFVAALGITFAIGSIPARMGGPEMAVAR